MFLSAMYSCLFGRFVVPLRKIKHNNFKIYLQHEKDNLFYCYVPDRHVQRVCN